LFTHIVPLPRYIPTQYFWTTAEQMHGILLSPSPEPLLANTVIIHCFLPFIFNIPSLTDVPYMLETVSFPSCTHMEKHKAG
jgi:hypothetical protein